MNTCKICGKEYYTTEDMVGRKKVFRRPVIAKTCSRGCSRVLIVQREARNYAKRKELKQK